MKTALIVVVAVVLLGVAVALWAQPTPAADPAAALRGAGLRGMMTGAPAMMALEGSLYIVMNGTLYKVDPATMTLVGSVELVKREAAAGGAQADQATRAARRAARRAGKQGGAAGGVQPPAPGAQGPAPAQ